ncbi:hypothetical protein [Gallaecimonas sp. GXIMD1310]|uniref:hypothetical protein n=1 Tax=Gallaecimonas sp. GXIMD1310 TaxID=3131926 RepID=UPI0032479944
MTDQQPNTMHIGGSVEQALAGTVSIDSKAILKEAWQGVASPSRLILAPALLLIGGTLMLVAALSAVLEMSGLKITDPMPMQFAQLLLVAMVAPALAGLQMIALHTVVGLKPPIQLLWLWYRRGPLLSLAALMTMALTVLGSVVFIVIGLFINIAVWPVLMLVADKRQGPSQAIVTAIRVCLRYPLPFILLFLLQLLTFLLGIVTFGIALVWLVPFWLRCQGILYRELFGVVLKMNVNKPQALFNA